MTEHKKRGHRRRPRPKPKRGPRREHIEELHPVDNPPDIDSFEEWELGPEIQRAIANMDITVPTPIQALAIGPVLEGRDVIAKAETGTGKTLAFGAPMMSRIDPARSTVLSLILCPTRELAQQVCDVIAALALPRGVRVALVVGGDPMHPQIAALQAGAQVVVGTPGRVLDLYQQRFLSFPWAETIVLDEADKMFEIGFLDDIKKIISYFPEERQTLLFSATFPTEVLKLARSETKDPIEIATQRGTATVSAIQQNYIAVDEGDRALVLTRLFEQSSEKDVFLVFCDRRTEVDRLLRRLERLPFSIKALHGGYDQPSRYRVMSAFRTGEVKALLATDVASRGLDVEHVTHVINYSVPRDTEDYTHRIGRTGRAGRTGNAITFVTPGDQRRWRQLRNHTKWDIPELEAPGRRRSMRPERRGERDAERPEREGRRGRSQDGRRTREDREPKRGGGERRERGDSNGRRRGRAESRRKGDGRARAGRSKSSSKPDGRRPEETTTEAPAFGAIAESEEKGGGERRGKGRRRSGRPGGRRGKRAENAPPDSSKERKDATGFGAGL